MSNLHIENLHHLFMARKRIVSWYERELGAVAAEFAGDAVVRTGSSHGVEHSAYPNAQFAHPAKLRENAHIDRVP